ncbi:ThiF family adenylyltransferase [Aeromicrobium sp.]|uniref:HesA/MoeB/ThiF family protein n=1 Tax=Aeromicrobium sp. TaxID=1871063 RepID=UPI0030C040B5
MASSKVGRIALSEEHFADLVGGLNLTVETAAVVAATLVTASPATGAKYSLLGQTTTRVPDDAYLKQTDVGLAIASSGWVPAFRAAIKNGQIPVFVHTHPAGKAFFSTYDDVVDAELAAAARDFGAPAYASMVVAGRSDAPVVTARACIFAGGRSPSASSDAVHLHPVEALRVAGTSLRIMLPPNPNGDENDRDDSAAAHGAFDRQVRMLGEEGQRTLGAINVAIVGTGGTGSAVAVQLARIGMGSICLVDDDVVTPPTATRGHGMRMADIGRPKVSVLADHLRDIGLGSVITEVNAPLHSPEALQAVQHADVVFSCVDGHGARLILNRFAYAHLAVVIDLAVLVALSDVGAEVDERVTWLGPGAACLLCRGRLDAALAYAENLDPEARKALAGEGYVQAAETPQPAIVTLTTLVASLAATELLMRLVGIGSPAATELLLRPHVGELRRNRLPQRSGCFCSDSRYLGRGQKQPYLDLMWPVPPLAPSDKEAHND